MAVYFAPVGTGLGDLIVALPVLQWLIENSGEEVVLVERGPRQQGLVDRISGLSGSITEKQWRPLVDGKAINLRNHPLCHSWNWGGPKFEREFADTYINDIQRIICKETFGFEPDFDRVVPLQHNGCEQTSGKVLLVPGTTCNYKSWSTSAWSRFCHRLRDEAIDYLLIGEPARSTVVSDLVAKGEPHYPTPSIGEAIDAISSAAAVVAVDTGLMHISVQQGIRTIALMNKINLWMRPYEHCHVITSPRCKDACIPQYGDHPTWSIYFKEWSWSEGVFDYCKASTDTDSWCMAQIDPEHVLNTLRRVLPAATRA